MAYEFAGQYGPEPFLSDSGKLLKNAPVAVYVPGTLTLATLYTDRAKTATALNPTEVDSTGTYRFFADPGNYEVEVYERRVEVQVPIDPAEEEFDLTGFQARSEKGQPNGYAGLDGAGKVPSVHLPGGGGGRYEHVQPVPASSWNVIHNLGHYPVVNVIDDGDERIIVEEAHPSVNQMVLTFAAPTAGRAVLM